MKTMESFQHGPSLTALTIWETKNWPFRMSDGGCSSNSFRVGLVPNALLPKAGSTKDTAGSAQVEAAEDCRSRDVPEVVLPRDAVLIEEIHDRPGDRLVAAGRRDGGGEGREDLRGRQVTERRGGQRVGAVGKCRTDDGREVAIAD